MGGICAFCEFVDHHREKLLKQGADGGETYPINKEDAKKLGVEESHQTLKDAAEELVQTILKSTPYASTLLQGVDKNTAHFLLVLHFALCCIHRRDELEKSLSELNGRGGESNDSRDSAQERLLWPFCDDRRHKLGIERKPVEDVLKRIKSLEDFFRPGANPFLNYNLSKNLQEYKAGANLMVLRARELAKQIKGLEAQLEAQDEKFKAEREAATKLLEEVNAKNQELSRKSTEQQQSIASLEAKIQQQSPAVRGVPLSGGMAALGVADQAPRTSGNFMQAITNWWNKTFGGNR